MPPVLIIYLMSSLEKVKASLKTAALNDPRAFLRPAQQEKGEGSRVRPSVHCCKWQLIWESRTQQHSGISPYQPPCTGVPESDLPAGQRGPREHPPPRHNSSFQQESQVRTAVTLCIGTTEPICNSISNGSTGEQSLP